MLFTLIPIFVAVIATVIWSHFKIKHGKKPFVWIAVISALSSSISFFLIISFAEAGQRALHFEYWQGSGKFDGVEVIAPLTGILAAICMVPSYLALLIQQRLYNRN